MDDERVSQDPTAENETDAEDRNDGDTSGTAAPRPVQHQRRLLLFVIAGAVLAADLLTKILAVANIEPGRPVWLIGTSSRCGSCATRVRRSPWPPA